LNATILPSYFSRFHCFSLILTDAISLHYQFLYFHITIIYYADIIDITADAITPLLTLFHYYYAIIISAIIAPAYAY